MKYIDDEIIENVNFALCSQIWNDCLLIPKMMSDNPNLVVNNMIQRIIIDLAYECMTEVQEEQLSVDLTYEDQK